MSIRRNSRQKEAILEVLRNTDEHPDASVIYERVRKLIPNISLGTVYRNLAVMADERDILRLSGNSASVHYDGNTYPHYHVVCERCGKIDDIFTDFTKEVDAFAEKAYKGKIEEHSLIFYGLCEECTKENN